MNSILEFLSQFPPEKIFFIYLGFLFLNILGTVPSNSDLLIITGAFLATLGKFDFLTLYLGVLSIVLLGENILYGLGYFFGPKIFRLKFYQKIMPLKRRLKLQKFVNLYPTQILISIRLMPILRPVMYLAIGNFRISPKVFIKRHLTIVILYYSLILCSFYFASNTLTILVGEYKVYALLTLSIIWIALLRSLRKKFMILPE